MSASPRPVVAAFDFDGTVSTRDNVLPYLRRVAGTGRMLSTAIATAPQLVAAQFIDERRDVAKVAVTRRIFAGREVAAVAGISDSFATKVIARHLVPKMIERIEWHRSQSHRVLFVSASLNVYLEEIGRRLGVDATLATELAVVDGHYSGEVSGPNVRRAEKVVRLDAWLAAEGLAHAEVWAYGDSRGDTELLRRADYAFWVKRGVWNPA